MRTRKADWFTTLEKRAGTPEIGLTLHGFASVTGRKSDRVRLASRTRDPVIYERRVQLVRWLHEHHHDLLIVALIERRVMWRTVERAQVEGAHALRRLTQAYGTPELCDASREYIEHYRRVNVDNLRQHLTAFSRWMEQRQHATVADMTTVRVLEFLQQLTRGDNKKSKRGEVTNATRNRYRNSLSGFASWCIMRGWMHDHPIAHRRVPQFREASARMPVLQPDEVRRYLHAVTRTSHKRVSGDDHMVRALVLALCITTGADVGEVLALTTSHVQHVVTDTGTEHDRLVFKRSKTATHDRLVPLVHPEVRVWLHAHLARMKREKRTGALFPALALHHLWPVHRAARKHIGHDTLSIKDLRHIAAQMWRRAGADLQQVSEWLGHASIEQTEVYAAFGPDAAHDSPVVKALQALVPHG